ncbi:MAG: exopolysaccharide biosynthesis protein [Rhabdochlamydiaceae bacterium]|nr:exopolysaccharide biosynthesis protein [Rhabdochlamydiaceae bacterium]
MTKNKQTSLQDCLIPLQKRAQHGSVTVGEMIFILRDQSGAILLLLLALPFCLPIQIPGLSVPFGLAIAFIGMRQGLKKPLWLPKKLKEKSLAGPKLDKIITHTLRITFKLNRWIHPRFISWFHSPSIQTINHLLVVVLGLLLALPLPIPFTNLSAAWAIFLMQLAILEEDGIFLIASYVLFLATLLIFAATLFSIKFILSYL